MLRVVLYIIFSMITFSRSLRIASFPLGMRLTSSLPASQASAASFLEGLNDNQKLAVEAPLGSASLCIAGPGSGKTKVLTHRIGWLLSPEIQQNGGSVLAITFTNKAAAEMRHRLERLIGPESAKRCTISTFHSFSTKLLRFYGVEYLASQLTGSGAVDSSFTICDQEDALKVVKELMKEELGGEDLTKVQIKPNAVLNAMNKIREAQVMTSLEHGSGLVDTTEYRELLEGNGKTKTIRLARKILPGYRERIYGANSLDFEDLLLTAYKLLHVPEVLAKVQSRFRHILVDEYQDTNIPQYEMIRKLSPAHYLSPRGLADAPQSDFNSSRYDLKSRSLFAVGDKNQAIYSWRGARPSNMESLAEHYPSLVTFNLMQNYRCSPAIAEVANAVIGEVATTTDVTKRHIEAVRVVSTQDDEDQARCVSSIIETIQNDGAAKMDIAVFYRTNSQSRALEQMFVERGIRYKLVGGRRFYDRKEIKDVLCFLRIVVNPMDVNALERAMKEVARGVGEKTRQAFFQWVDRSTQEVVQKMVKEGQLRSEDALPSSPSPLVHLLTLLDESKAREPSAKDKKTKTKKERAEPITESVESAIDVAAIRSSLSAQDQNQLYVSSDVGLSSREEKALASFATSLFHLYETALSKPLTEVLEEISERFVTPEYLVKISKSQEEASDRQANINELLVAAGKYRTGQRMEIDPWSAEGDLLELEEGEGEQEMEEAKEEELDYGEGEAALPSGALRAMLEDASLLAGEELGDEAGREKQNMVYLMTIHASKGLEFDTVFLTGVEEGCLPITREPEDREYNPRVMKIDPCETEAVREERRLAFVAITRAKRILFLTHRQRMSVFSAGGMKHVKCDQSRFLLPLTTLPKHTLAKMRWKSPKS